MINYNKSDYRENEKCEMENVVSNTILRRNEKGEIIEVDIPDDIEDEKKEG